MKTKRFDYVKSILSFNLIVGIISFIIIIINLLIIKKNFIFDMLIVVNFILIIQNLFIDYMIKHNNKVILNILKRRKLEKIK